MSTGSRYIWQNPDWPQFSYQARAIAPALNVVMDLQQQLLGGVKQLPTGLDRQAEMDALIQNALQTSEIEGESLNVGSVRSSVARHLGLENAAMQSAAPTLQTDSLVAMLCDATSDLQSPISQQQLCNWQAALFPEAPIIKNIVIGELRGDAPMQVISQRAGREIVHFQAPPKRQLEEMLANFIQWFNQPLNVEASYQGEGILRAAIAHLWLITLHPFDDGNGRVARALTDRALAQAENTSNRFYSLSAAIEQNRIAYYEILENTQGCKTSSQQHNELDITEWLQWFLGVLGLALQQGLQRIQRVKNKARFWQTHAQTILSERQIKILNRLLDNAGEEFIQNGTELGINASKYKSLANVSKATATRDLSDLVSKGCLKVLPAGGRSTRYTINYATPPDQPIT